MAAIDYCSSDVEIVPAHTTVADAARIMQERGIGSVVVQTPDGPGIVTDRDLVIRSLAEGRDPKVLAVGEILSSRVTTLPETASLAEAAALMRLHAVRRLPVVRAGGEIAGIVTFDDLIELLGRELGDIAGAIRGEAGD